MGSFAVNDVIDVYAQGLYTDLHGEYSGLPGAVEDVTMPASNPFIPPDLKRLLDARPR